MTQAPLFPDVRPTPDRLGFSVQSRSNVNEWHGVTFRIGGGICDCPHFIYRIDRRMTQGKVAPLSPESRCWHLKRALEYLAVREIVETLKREQQTSA